jgi:hypothetical protein
MIDSVSYTVGASWIIPIYHLIFICSVLFFDRVIVSVITQQKIKGNFRGKKITD